MSIDDEDLPLLTARKKPAQTSNLMIQYVREDISTLETFIQLRQA
ncbi:hypothetical protein [Psychrobacter sp. AH5]